MKRNRKKGLIPLLLIFSIYFAACQAPSAQSSWEASSKQVSSAEESSSEQASWEASSQEDSSVWQSSQEDSSSQEDGSSQEDSSQAEPSHEHAPLPDDGDCTTPILCACDHVMVAGEEAHRFDNACDTDCNNENCAHVRTFDGHKDENENGKCDYCNADLPKDGGFELPEDKFH